MPLVRSARLERETPSASAIRFIGNRSAAATAAARSVFLPVPWPAPHAGSRSPWSFDQAAAPARAPAPRAYAPPNCPRPAPPVPPPRRPPPASAAPRAVDSVPRPPPPPSSFRPSELPTTGSSDPTAVTPPSLIRRRQRYRRFGATPLRRATDETLSPGSKSPPESAASPPSTNGADALSP